MDKKEKQDIAPVSERKNGLQSVSSVKHKGDYSVSRDIVQGGRLTVSKQRGKIRAERTVNRIKTGFDRPLLVIILILLLFGTVMVFSASYAWAQNDYGDSFYWVKKHIMWVGLGIGAMLLIMQVDYRFFKAVTPIVFGFSFILLCLVPIIGKTVNGAKRWIVIGPLQVQPTELVKVTLVLILSWYISKYVVASRDLDSLTVKEKKKPVFRRSLKEYFPVFIREVAIPFAIVGIVCVVTLLERHMSGTIILFCIGMVVIFVGRVSARWICALFAVGGAGALALILTGGYTSDRIMAWRDPFKYVLNEGWQIVQSLYAISSGGLFGVGLGNSTQKHMYLPEPQNDYIFAIICEELGFIGALVMFLLFGILIWRGIAVSRRAPDSFSKLVAIGITGKVAIQAILNVFVVTNIFPPTGISLPFFSYGGTALVFLLCEMGILLSISRYSYQE